MQLTELDSVPRLAAPMPLSLFMAKASLTNGGLNEAQPCYSGKRPTDTCEVGLEGGDLKLHHLPDGKGLRTADFAAFL